MLTYEFRIKRKNCGLKQYYYSMDYPENTGATEAFHLILKREYINFQEFNTMQDTFHFGLL